MLPSRPTALPSIPLRTGDPDNDMCQVPSGTCTIYYECLGRWHRAYDDRKAEHHRKRNTDGPVKNLFEQAIHNTHWC